MANDRGRENTLRTLLVDELRDLYDAEKQLVKALPKLAKGATSDDLRELIQAHLKETEGHVDRLERAFEQLDERARGKHCAGIAGIVEEASELLGEDFEGAVMDAGIVAGAQRAEHYEIAAYGSVIEWAKLLDESDIASLLHQTLEEEKGADQKLTSLATGSINGEAAATDNGEMEEAEEPESRASTRRMENTGSARAASSRRR